MVVLASQFFSFCCYAFGGGGSIPDTPAPTRKAAFLIQGEIRNRGGNQIVRARIFRARDSGKRSLEAEIAPAKPSRAPRASVLGAYPILMKVRGGDGWERMNLTVRKSKIQIPVFGSFRLHHRLRSTKEGRQRLRGVSRLTFRASNQSR